MSDGVRVAAVVCLLVFVGIGVSAQGQPAPEAGIGAVSVSGGGIITATETGNDSTYVWHDEPVNVSVAFTDYPDARNYRVCLGYERAEAPTKPLVPECDPVALPDGTNGTAGFSNVTWPANATGEEGLTVELQRLSNQSNTTTLDRKTVPVTVLRKQGDFDNDGLANTREVEDGFNVSNSDMDADGLPDGAEVNQYGSNPQKSDTDGDGVRDGVEIQQGTNASAADTDGDGLGDRTEITLGTDPTNEWTPVWLAAAVLVAFGVVGVVVVFGRRGWRERFGGPAAPSNGNGETGAAATDDGGGDTPTPTASTPEPAHEPTPTPEPLTDEDRVRTLLRDHGGRMRQSRIVEETEWSKAKVSRLLSSMNDEGTIDKLSIGRENIISLDGHRPEAAQPPHEENASD